jgi:hypothetical protein
MPKYFKLSASTLVAVLAISLAMLGSAVAAPTTLKITKSTIRKIADKEIDKTAPTLVVAKANSATTATTATTATNADALGGRSLAQVQTVIAGAENQNAFPIGTGTGVAGTGVVTLNYTLAVASKVSFEAVVELEGDDTTADRAQCNIRSDGVIASSGYESSFEDANTANPESNAIVTFLDNVPAGAHVASMRCLQTSGTGTINKDAAAINIVAVPN